MIIYHGSESIIKKPEYGKGKAYNDYGLGFYCTEDLDLAMEWAVDSTRDGYVNCYHIDVSGLRILDLNAAPYSILTWVAILINNRRFSLNSPIAKEAKEYIIGNFLPEYEEYDIIRGYRADDSYFSYAQDFLDNTISVEQLNVAMHLGNLGEQIVLKSKRAFEQIVFDDYKIAQSDKWFTSKESRDRVAREDYYRMEKLRFNRDDTYILNILDKELKADDFRI